MLLESWRNNFDETNWKDKSQAWKLLNQAFELVREAADFEQIRPVIISLFDLLPEDEQAKMDKSLLLG